MWYKLNSDNVVQQVVAHHTNPSSLVGFVEIDTDEDILGKVYDAETDTFSDAPMTADQARIERDRLLAESDWMALQDRTMSDAEREYRQALRDITGQSGFPANVTWPTKPE